MEHQNTSKMIFGIVMVINVLLLIGWQVCIRSL